MKRKPKKKTDWIRYRIAGRGGGGWDTDHWLYVPGWGDEAEEDLREYIVRCHHSWACYAESYTFRLWRNETPPADVIRREIKSAKQSAKFSRERANELIAQLPKGNGGK